MYEAVTRPVVTVVQQAGSFGDFAGTVSASTGHRSNLEVNTLIVVRFYYFD